MDLHVYRNSQDRWHHLRDAARKQGAVLALNAFTVDELVQRLTPDVITATPGQQLAVVGDKGADPSSDTSSHGPFPNFYKYAYDAISQLKASRVRPHELRDAGLDFLAGALERYDRVLHQAGFQDPQDRCAFAAARVREGTSVWLKRFERVVLHALYDLTEAEFVLMRSIIEALPDGGTVVLFNTTANVKPTQFAEWTWSRFIQDDSLAEKTFPEFCRPSNPNRAVLEKLFTFDAHDPLPPDDSLRIVEAPGRYKEVEKIGGDIVDLLSAGESPNDVVVIVRQIETYGEMLEDVFIRYGIPHRFETGVPLLRIPLVKYWLSMLDLVTSERSREALARVMSSAYFTPRLSPGTDVSRELVKFGYIDRYHLRASAMAARKNSPLAVEFERFEAWLDELESAHDTIFGFMARLQPAALLGERDRQAWRALEDELLTVGAVIDRPQSRNFEAVGGHRPPLQFAEFRRIASEIAGLRTVARSTTAAAMPGVPQVRIMHPNSLGAREHKWIFAPGFSDGDFPGHCSPNPLLPDQTIENINTRIRPRRLMTGRDRNRREPLYLFMILDSATRRVTLTYPSSTLEGDPICPSIYVGEIVRHYAESPVTQAAQGPARSDGEWRSQVAREWGRRTLAEHRARALLGDDIVDRAKIESKGIERARVDAGLVPLDRIWNPSELNALDSCPFVFLARHRLKLRAAERPDFEVPAQEIGILAHAILRDFYSQPVPACADEARDRMNQIIARRLSAADINGEGAYTVFDPSLWKIRRRQLVSVLDRYINFAVRDALDGFETLPQYLDSPLPPAALGRALLAGKPDHVAVRRDGGRIGAVRIDDFKYSAASSSTVRQLKQSFQIPVYAYLTTRALGAQEGTPIEGRYLLLRSPGNPVVSHPIDEAVFLEVQERIQVLLEKVQAGKLEPDPADRQMCIDCDYRRLCRLYGR